MQQLPQLLRQRTRPRRRVRPGACIGAGALGGLIMYFADPVSGAYRRTAVRDRLMASLRGVFRGITGLGRGAAAQAYSVAQHSQHMQPEHWSVPNDATLTQRVETELFRDPDIPKGCININAEAGIVVLRGELDSPELMRSIGEKVERMPGVRGVHNLLHPTGTAAPDAGSVLRAAR